MSWFVVVLGSIFAAGAFAQMAAQPEPDARFKADILLVVAHPDDEGMAIGYLAKAVLDQHKRVAVIFGTRGDGGGNAIGMEQAAALGAEREIEARRALGTLGITNVWFVGAPDTPGQNVLRSLETWNHSSALGQVVRLVRLTRPEVIMTWLPAYSAGENHGDHQAASVIATEAFDVAGDPTAFAEQVAPPRDHSVSGTLTEGLHPWQAEKLYFFSDAANTAALDGKGPQYPWDEMSPSRDVTYGHLALESIAQHETQDYPGQMAIQALKSGDAGVLKQMKTRLVLGKSLVRADAMGDVFEGVVAGPIPFRHVSGYEVEPRSNLSAELGGPWAFYKLFWKAHDLPALAGIFPPEVRVGAAEEVTMPLLLHNDTADITTFAVTALSPPGWSAPQDTASYIVRPHESREVTISLPTPAKPTATQILQAKVTDSNAKVTTFDLKVTVASGSLPQY
jgi:LmbE family N-acetylglucosaminyl deacetylase